MYNEKLKKKFLMYCENMKDVKYITNTQRLFAMSEEFECLLNKDLNNMSKEEVIEIIKCYECSSVNTIRGIMTIFNNYRNWCESSGKPVGSFSFDVYDVYECFAKKPYLSMIQLQMLVSIQQSIITKFIVQALIEGISGEHLSELITARSENINEKEQTIDLYSYDCKGRNSEILKPIYSRKINISRQLVDIAHSAIEENNFSDEKGNIKGLLMDSGGIIKYREPYDVNNLNKKEIRFLAENIRHRIMRLNIPSMIQEKVSATYILESGVCNKLKSIEKNYEVPHEYVYKSGLREVKEELKKLEHQYNMTKNNIEEISQKYLL